MSNIFLNEDFLTEISKDFMDRAIKRQETLLGRRSYLQKISAWQYIKSLNRLEDFRKYAQAIADAINSGDEGTPEDPMISKKEAEMGAKEANVAKQDAEIAAKEIKSVVPTEKREEEVNALVPEENRDDWGEPIIPKFPFAAKIRKGKYFVTYISHIDNDEMSVWVEANCIKNAVNKAIAEVSDIKEIKNVIFEDDYKGAKNPENLVVDPNQNTIALGNEIANKLTDGQFSNMSELVADVKDDETTLKCATGDMYTGTDNTGREWEGPKSSYMEVLNSDVKKYSDAEQDYGINVVLKIVPGGNDIKSEEIFNVQAFKRALRNGIVHFNYLRKRDGVERQAFGTTNQKIIEENGSGFKGVHKENPDIIRYFDMTARAWRSFAIVNVTTIYDEMYGEKTGVQEKRRRGRPRKTT